MPPKGRARGAVPLRRRPAAAVGRVRLRPAAADPPVVGEELDLKEAGIEDFLSAPFLKVSGLYWEGQIELAGIPCGGDIPGGPSLRLS